MQERAAELGGWCTVTTGEHGGTRVLAHLPREAG
jgi:nitrate/nitrite-specific signal transduction histidine kinase